MDAAGIILENKKRRQKFKMPYNPHLGIGSPIKRFLLLLKNDSVLYLPEPMREHAFVKDILSAGSLETYAKSAYKAHYPEEKYTIEVFALLLDYLMKIRFQYDFEYWAATTITITDKKTALPIPFILNEPQRKYLVVLEEDRLERIPIRVIVDKSRQWGGSTLTQIYMFWFQNILKRAWNSCIVADVEDQARNIRAMYSKAAENYPKQYGSITLSPFEGSSKNKVVEESESVISIGSMQKPENLRSADLKMAHLSEIGLWKATQNKKPEDVIQTLVGTIPRLPDTIIVKESTAKGVGNYFHTFWVKSVNGETGYRTVFVSWYEFADNQVDIKPGVLKEFISSMEDNEYEQFLWDMGATLEGINWYREKLKEYGGDEWRMQSEFPSSADESFQSTGQRVFPRKYVQNARLNNTPPLYKGYISSDGETGKDAMKNVVFEESITGNLWLWALPDKSIKVSHRYLVTLDIGGASDGADWSIFRVFDRYWMTEPGGVPEAIGTWELHVDQDILAWLGVKLCIYFNNALYAVESNSLESKANTEGDGYLTILNEIVDFYPHIYTNSKVDAVKEGVPVRYGFHTNKATKSMVINKFKAALREHGYIERDKRVMDECDTFERKKDGTMGAVDGSHDDKVMSTSTGVYIAIDDMPLPKVIKVDPDRAIRRRNRNLGKSEATF